MKKSLFMFLIVLLCLASPSWATTYYIDLDSGNDTSAGTSTGTAWKTIPGTRNVGYTTFTTDASWGTGTVIFDGTSFTTGYPVIYVRVNGVKWDAVSNYTIK